MVSSHTAHFDKSSNLEAIQLVKGVTIHFLEASNSYLKLHSTQLSEYKSNRSQLVAKEVSLNTQVSLVRLR